MTAPTDLRLVLDQYNRQLNYFRDTAQKLNLVIGSANYIRMADAHRALGTCIDPDGPALRELGILRHEPPLVALAWGTLYAAVHGGFLIAVYLVKWH